MTGSPPQDGPNVDLARTLLADGHDVAMLVRHCGFPSLRAARQFANQDETREAVRGLLRERAARVGIKAVARLEAILDDQTSDARSAVAAARTALELAGLTGRTVAPPVRRVTELSVAELNDLIESTRRQLEAAQQLQTTN